MGLKLARSCTLGAVAHNILHNLHLAHAPRKITVGDPSDDSNKMGALVSKEHLAKVTGYVDLARREGCKIHCGHGVETLDLPEPFKNGYFMRPTVITDVSDDSQLMQEEVFGPVTCIVPFKTELEVGERDTLLIEIWFTI